VWACRVLSLVCTMRCDLRLSRLLKHFKHELVQGRPWWTLEQRPSGAVPGAAPNATPSLVRYGGYMHHGGYVRLPEDSDNLAQERRCDDGP